MEIQEDHLIKLSIKKEKINKDFYKFFHPFVDENTQS